jgi:hypothetical protein
MWQKGQKIQAKLIEKVDKDHWIASFQGQLLQVKNSTAMIFQEGLLLQLVVVSTKPLSFKVAQGQTTKKRINISI